MSSLILGMGIVAIVLAVAALTSRLVEAAPISFPMIFLGLGLVLGSNDVIRLDVHSPLLEAMALISLALVLFLDAVNVQIEELRADWYIPLLTLGPGTLLSVAGIATAAYFLTGLPLLQVVLLGAILASTDPVVLRDILHDERVPRAVRRALGIEAGMNDLVVLPIVLVLIAVLTLRGSSAADWLGFLFRILVLSPLVGLAVGGLGSWLMGRADASMGIRREYQALYGIGLVLACFAAGQAAGGDGFLAAFFGGFSISLFNMTLCDCFMDYGEVTAEMMMLLTFVLFGAVLAELLPTVPWIVGIALALIALLAVRPLALGAVLLPAHMSWLARGFIGWFGPRGLNSLLLALLAVQAHVPGAETVLAVAGWVVVVSVLLHGITATPLAIWYGRRTAAATLVEERENSFTGLFEADPNGLPRITPAQLAAQLAGDDPPLVLDVRSRSSYGAEPAQIPGSVRVPPGRVEEWAQTADKRRSVVAYCT
jgi:NhaP-type Na+/H+ or K+/H+ antiporter